MPNDEPEFCQSDADCEDDETCSPDGGICYLCDAAGCDGFGACDQAYSFEPIGTPCVVGDVCTDPDLCDAIGQCAGQPLYPEPVPGSPISATSLCLTATAGARTVIRVDLRDGGGAPVSGAIVEIRDDQGNTSWFGPETESASTPGTYFRVWQVDDSTGPVTFTVATPVSSSR